MAESDHAFVVGMPHMVPGRLSEVELLKLLGEWQWEGIARHLGRPSVDLAADGERLYASFVSVELAFPAGRRLHAFGEGARVSARSRLGVYARRFVEGLYVLDAEPVPDTVLAAVAGPADLARLDRPWACLTSTFVARLGSNARLKVFEPEGMDAADLPALAELPAGIAAHQRVAATGTIEGATEGVAWGPAAEVAWPIGAESDLNGAGLVYFARYVTMMDHAVRRLVCDHGLRMSAPLAACLATEHRRVYYYANADASDTVRCVTRGWLLPGGPDEPAGPGRTRRARLRFRTDLYRASDGVWMAASVVTKGLAVPDGDKALHLEVQRLVAALTEAP